MFAFTNFATILLNCTASTPLFHIDNAMMSRPLRSARTMTRSFYPLVIAFLQVAVVAPACSAQIEWRAGFARVDITPKEAVRMAGYGSRNRPSEGVDTPLSVRCFALQDSGDASPRVLGQLRSQLHPFLPSPKNVQHCSDQAVHLIRMAQFTSYK